MPSVPLSPLWYPGGKTRFVPHLTQWLGDVSYHPRWVVEPFCGGASVSLGMLAADAAHAAVIADADPLVAQFWMAATEHTEDLLDVMMSEPVTVERWKHWKTLDVSRADVVTVAMKTLFLNRTTFSGLIRHGSVLGGIDQDEKIANGEVVKYPVGCRFNKVSLANSLRRIGEWHDKGRLLAWFCPYEETLDAAPRNGMVYLDPPYVEKSDQLYGRLFTEDCHRILAESAYAVAEARKVIISYDDLPLIRDLYSNEPMHIDTPTWSYGMGKNKQSREVLIHNLGARP